MVKKPTPRFPYKTVSETYYKALSGESISYEMKQAFLDALLPDNGVYADTHSAIIKRAYVLINLTEL